MLGLVTICASSFVIGLSGAMMPGPLLTATIAEAGKRGWVAGPLMMVGHGILEMALVIGLLLGLAPLLQKDAVFAAISLAGAGVLFFMSIGMFRSLPGLTLSLEPPTGGGKRLVAAGALMSVANPYWSVWWATIGLGYLINVREFGIVGIAAFFIGHIASDIGWYAFVSTAVAKGKRVLSDRVYRAAIAVCAVFLALFGVWFFVSGLKKVIA